MPMPCSEHAVFLKATARPSLDGRALLWLRVGTAWSEHGMDMAWKV